MPNGIRKPSKKGCRYFNTANIPKLITMIVQRIILRFLSNAAFISFLLCYKSSAAGPKYVLHSTRYLRQEHAHEASRRVHYAVASWTHT